MANLIRDAARRLLGKISAYAHKEALVRNRGGGGATQILLSQHYRSLARGGREQLPSFAEVGFREFSEFEEDGILLFLFSIIRPRTRTCLEICAGNGMQCNTTNLIVNHGWWGVLFDGDPNNVARAQDFFRRHKDTFLYPPKFQQAWITAESVNDHIRATGLKGEIDLLSLDIDGMDYWVWKAIDVVDPIVVVCEVNNAVSPSDALTVPYDAQFVAPDGDYRGASLKAMCNLARAKNYRLVGVHRFGFNAFFVKNGFADDLLPEVSVDSCAKDPFTQHSHLTRWPGMRDKAWANV
jgi:hypothetical protein